MFCDLVGSTALSAHFDPEELRELIRAYQQTSAAIIEHYEGYIAQYLGDGLLVYFGYPVAHEDDAQRAVRAGLEVIAALQPQVSLPLVAQASSLHAAKMAAPLKGLGEGRLQVRIGIHTGPVVVGEMGGGIKREQLALGETPNIAARLQGIAEPDTVVISAAVHRLSAGFFTYRDLGLHTLKGTPIPVAVSQVLEASSVQSRFEMAVGAGLTPLVGRDLEVSLLRERWTQAKEGEGQVILLSGEAGIGKSRLVQTLKEQATAEGATRLEFRCSPYHQNSAFYPIIDHLQRLLQFHRDDAPQAKLEKLQETLARYRFPQADTVPLLAALLSLPQPKDAPHLTWSPQKQKQKTHEALVGWMLEEAQQQTVYCAWEDLHWADPSTLEFLSLFLDQVPTSRLLVVLTFRPDFTPPWRPHSHMTQLMLNRLSRQPVEAMVETITGGKSLPREVIQQIVARTDGVPLFVEELTKMVVESGFDVEARHAVPLPVGIPATIHDALMARLDRLGPTKEIAQVGATLGREFSYELLHAVSPLAEVTLQQGLRQLVEAELLYQRGLSSQATYLFKHALVQDTAYQSLLKSKRQQLHKQIAQVLAERFSETKETQPELLAHHYTEAGLITQAIPYWQQAGQRASQRSAYMEAVSHLTKGLEVLKLLPDTPERARQELDLQIILGPTLIATKGWGASELEKSYTRARELCHQVGEIAQLFTVLWGLWVFYYTREELRKAHELGEQLLSLAQSVQDSALLLEAHLTLGYTLHTLGEFVSARDHFEQGIALYDPQQHHALAFLYAGVDPGMAGLSVAAWVQWMLGYPDQAQERMRDAITLARKLSHSHSLAFALLFAAEFHQFRRARQTAEEQAEALITLATEQGFPYFPERAAITRGWALAEQGQGEDGIAQIRQGIALLD
jgi:class 3 adenylate cyclase/tetratricopeptide (TPR) repeat protein